MSTTAKERMYDQITKHGNNLNAIFHTNLDAVALCKKLHSLEHKAHRLTEDECNTGTDHEAELNKILDKVKEILFSGFISKQDAGIVDAIFINGDPRGYTLKIQDSYVREHNLVIEKDWGGYGILAPEFK
jgi:hypothetical protein